MACPYRRTKAYARFMASFLSRSHAKGRSRSIMPAIGGRVLLLSEINPHPPPPLMMLLDGAEVVALATLVGAELPFALYALIL